MRVIAGNFRGTRLYTPSGNAIRPTSDRLRESIFNIIGPRIRGTSILDLYAGTGALGIEALSRGAKRAVFIDNDPRALALTQRNIAKVNAGDRATVMAWDIARDLRCLRQQGAWDIIFMDPPYRQRLIQRTLENLSTAQTEFKMVVAEHEAEEALADRPAGFFLEDQRTYGKTLVSFLSPMV